MKELEEKGERLFEGGEKKTRKEQKKEKRKSNTWNRENEGVCME